MYRAMEGRCSFWIVGAGNIAGATFWLCWDHLGLYDVLTKGFAPINLLEEWGSWGALFGTLAMLLCWFLLASWWEKFYRFGRGLQVEKPRLVPGKAAGKHQ